MINFYILSLTINFFPEYNIRFLMISKSFFEFYGILS